MPDRRTLRRRRWVLGLGAPHLMGGRLHAAQIGGDGRGVPIRQLPIEPDGIGGPITVPSGRLPLRNAVTICASVHLPMPVSRIGRYVADDHMSDRTVLEFLIASESLPAIALAASRAASETTCPYLAVIWALLWPNSLPITGSPRLPFTPHDAKLWRRSWIRRSGNPAAVRILSQPSYIACLDRCGNTYSSTGLTSRRMATTGSGSTKVLAPVLLSGSRATPLSRSR